MLPDFNEHGFLPEGVSDASLEELRRHFASEANFILKDLTFSKKLKILMKERAW